MPNTSSAGEAEPVRDRDSDDTGSGPQEVAAAAVAMGRAQSANLAMINAVQAQHNAQITANATVVAAVTRILGASAPQGGADGVAGHAKNPASTPGGARKTDKAGGPNE